MGRDLGAVWSWGGSELGSVWGGILGWNFVILLYYRIHRANTLVFMTVIDNGARCSRCLFGTELELSAEEGSLWTAQALSTELASSVKIDLRSLCLFWHFLSQICTESQPSTCFWADLEDRELRDQGLL